MTGAGRSSRKENLLRHLAIEQVVYVPSTKGVHKPRKISQKEFKKRILEVKIYLAELFGGFSSDQIEGGYISKKGKHIIEEKIAKISSFSTTKEYKQKRKILFNQIRIWGKAWDQESVGYEYEGDMYYIPSAKE